MDFVVMGFVVTGFVVTGLVEGAVVLAYKFEKKSKSASRKGVNNLFMVVSPS